MKHGKKQPAMFFILSRPRTGSTLLRTLLDAHPNAVVPPECQYIINLQRRFGHIRQWDEATRAAFVAELPEQYLFDTWNMTTEHLVQALETVPVNACYADICMAVHAAYPSVYPTEELRLVGDKNPGYALYIPQLLETFPAAKFIHLVRDYRDNHISLSNAGFEMPWVGLTCAKWRHFYNTVARHQRDRPRQFLQVRYEDLVQAPEAELERICTFLGIPYVSNLLDFHQQKERFLEQLPKDRMEKFHPHLMTPVSPMNAEKWHSELSPRQVASADLASGKSGRQAGYPVGTQSAPLISAISAASGRIAASLVYLGIRIADALPYRLRHWLLQDGTARLERAWRLLAGRGH